MKTKTMTVYDWFDIQNKICEIMGINEDQFRDLKGSDDHFYKWCDSKGYVEKDPEGKCQGSSQIWFKEYNQAPDGAAACPEHCDLNRLADGVVIPEGVRNGSIETLFPIADYEKNAKKYHKDVDWKKAFFDAYQQTLLELDPKGEGIDVEFSW
jgi:hypothetical protein